jgi:RimJ/RimL family protein N-acetyltransferase
VKILVGAANEHVSAVEEQLAEAPGDMRLLTDVDDVPALMAWADVALSAAGTTAWELACMGLPAAVVVLADNQRPIAEQLADAGAAVDLGPADAVTTERIAAEVESLCRDAPRRRAQSEAGRQLIDGRGAGRVVTVMRCLDEPFPPHQPRLRTAREDDARPLWRLVNHPSVRRASFSSDPIPWPEHVRWFRSRLASDTARIWVLELDGLVLGPVRYERTDRDTALVSVHVAPPFRGRGLAVRMLDETWRAACEALGVRRVEAQIRRENTVSQRTFARAGFAPAAPAEVRGQACEVFVKDL